ncbi:hypothetical protein [Kitasatospora sp. NPDC001175]|uniref:hypothetical protein n=1 Tax=Kitasatospora sp. NPDC001175 TaxID=3157103 RepID=UPI003D024C84
MSAQSDWQHEPAVTLKEVADALGVIHREERPIGGALLNRQNVQDLAQGIEGGGETVVGRWVTDPISSQDVAGQVVLRYLIPPGLR